MKELGDNAQARTEAADLYVSKVVPEKLRSWFDEHIQDATGVKVIEWIKSLKAESGLGDTDPQQDGLLTQAEIEAMMQDPRYMGPNFDQAYIDKIDRAWTRLVGRGPAPGTQGTEETMRRGG